MNRIAALLVVVMISLVNSMAQPYLLVTKSHPTTCITAVTLANPGQVRFLPCSSANVSMQAWLMDASGHIYLASHPNYALGLGAQASAAKGTTLGYDAKVVIIDITVDTRATQAWKYVGSQGTGSTGYQDIMSNVFSDRVIWAPYTKTGSVGPDEIWVSARTSGAYNHFFMQVPIPTPAPTSVPTTAPTTVPVSGPVTVTGAVQDSYSNPVAGVTVTSTISTTTTDSSGNYIITVPTGVSNITISSTGYITVVVPVDTTKGTVVGNVVISQVLATGAIRIVLQWNSTGDFDTVLYWGDLSSPNFIGYYKPTGTCGVSIQTLDVDNTYAYGPETVTLSDYSSCSQGFDYYAASYSVEVPNTVTVTVFEGASIINSFTRVGPTNLPSYTDWAWHVFHLSPAGVVTYEGDILPNDPIA